jgi:hypothetical protein
METTFGEFKFSTDKSLISIDKICELYTKYGFIGVSENLYMRRKENSK